jgi:hypothetical protein
VLNIILQLVLECKEVSVSYMVAYNDTKWRAEVVTIVKFRSLEEVNIF